MDFTPVDTMSLDALYDERSGLTYWGEILQDTQPEQTQQRINELDREIEKREMDDHIVVYAVFYDMENDIPDAYVTTEVMAKYLLVDARETGDYIAMQITIEEWVKLLRSSPPTEG